MKKLLVLVLLQFVILTFGLSNVAKAVVQGQCSNCHTMHNSQQNGTMSVDGALHTHLLLNSCTGCHSTSGTDPFDSSTRYPYVESTSAGFNGNNCLAGGYFTDLSDSSDNHNNTQHSLDSTVVPTGYTGTWYQNGNGLHCAGSSGCHGNETIADPLGAIKGGHHGNAGFGYRMLVVGSTPVAGSGATDYEKDLIANNATGNVNTYSAGTSSTDATISELCGKCHGDFHGTGTGSAGAWVRHPTDVLMPGDWDIQNNALTASDYKNNPVGYVDAVVGAAGSRYVTCLSCHRAHGTGNDDLLRWAYSTQSAGGGNTYGCLGCHNKQR